MNASTLKRLTLVLLLSAFVGGTAGAQVLNVPYAARVSSPGDVFSIANTGTGGVGSFSIQNPDNSSAAVAASSNGSGVVVSARAIGTGGAGSFFITQPDNVLAALQAETNGKGWAGHFVGTGSESKGVYISAPPGQPGLEVARGTKNAVVATSRGARALYSEEATEVWFADYGFGRLEDGRALITIDPLFAEAVNVGEPYHVFLQAYGRADLYVSRRSAAAFEVRVHGGDPAVEFSYRIVARRRGYEHARLEPAPWADTDPNLYPHTWSGTSVSVRDRASGPLGKAR